MLAKATKAQEAEMNSLMALDQRKAEQKQKEQYGSYWR
jgi:hypothetical protein